MGNNALFESTCIIQWKHFKLWLQTQTVSSNSLWGLVFLDSDSCSRLRYFIFFNSESWLWLGCLNFSILSDFYSRLRLELENLAADPSYKLIIWLGRIWIFEFACEFGLVHLKRISSTDSCDFERIIQGLRMNQILFSPTPFLWSKCVWLISRLLASKTFMCSCLRQSPFTVKLHLYAFLGRQKILWGYRDIIRQKTQFKCKILLFNIQNIEKNSNKNNSGTFFTIIYTAFCNKEIKELLHAIG